MTGAGATVQRLDVHVLTVPTDEPESDGTAEWDATTMIAVEAHAGGETGLGWTYGAAAVGQIVRARLAPLVLGADPLRVGAVREAMRRACRNSGVPGAVAMAIAAVDAALWDLKARLLGVSLARLLGAVRESVPVYGSGGFTSYTDARLVAQLAGWVDDGIPRVKMKVGRDPARDAARVGLARGAVGPETELYVDANGALSRAEALRFAELYGELGVRWFEEPVTSDDLDGLRLVCSRVPAGMDVAAGEYAWTVVDFRRLLDAGAVTCLQADATRCQGISGLLEADALCAAYGVDLSVHCSPALHAHPCCGLVRLRHLEWFHDHVRAERLLIDGVLEPEDGALHPDSSRPGNGLALKHADASRYVV